MNKIGNLLKELEGHSIGVNIFSSKKNQKVLGVNGELTVPFASAAKLAIGFGIIKWVEEQLHSLDEIVPDIEFDSEEDSMILYPHFQGRKSLPLRDAIEVMIACHDNVVANKVVNHLGGWERVTKQVLAFYPMIHVTSDPRSQQNKGTIEQASALLQEIYKSYMSRSDVWTPIMNALVRQQGELEDVPKHHHLFMSGGLPTAFIHMGMLGEVDGNPILYVVGGKDVPNRIENQQIDLQMMKVLGFLYQEYLAEKS